jgi:putative oxidoreductase
VTNRGRHASARPWSLAGLDAPRAVRLLTGLAFFIAGIPKFAAHSWETGHFRTYGLPWPDAFVFMIGAIEIVGGLMLLAGIAVRPVALLLGAVMVGAIVTSGIGQGEWIPSLTVAPLLLAATLYLLWVGPEAAPDEVAAEVKPPAPTEADSLAP